MVLILVENSLKFYILTNFYLKNVIENAKYVIKIFRHLPKIIADIFLFEYFYVETPGQVVKQISSKLSLSSWRGIDHIYIQYTHML